MLEPADTPFVSFLRAPQVRTLARCAIASTMPADDEPRATYVLTCSAYQLKGAMLGFGTQGSIYKLSCRHLSAADMANLERATQEHARVRLMFADGDIVLADLKLERQGDGWTGIEGRLVGTRARGDL